jgi:hypothetical protein
MNSQEILETRYWADIGSSFNMDMREIIALNGNEQNTRRQKK